MLKKVFLLSLAVLIVSSVCAAEFSLNVMSFNIRYGTALDGENSWRHRRDIAVECIKHYDPDIVGLQECLSFQADYLIEQLPEYAGFGMAREADGRGESMTILYKKKVLAPMETGNFWLSETPGVPGSQSWDTACTRMVTWARFYHYEAQQFFYHFNTHFDHVSDAARAGAARLLSKRVAEREHGDTPAIVTGDFNATAGQSKPWQVLTEKALKDAWVIAEERVGPPMTMGGYSAPEEGVDRRIDWILITEGVECQRCETVLFNRDGRYPTDHYPVFAELTVPDQE